MKTLIRGALMMFAVAVLLMSAPGSAYAQDSYAPIPPAPLPGPGTITNTTGILSGEPGSSQTDNAAAFQVPVVAAAPGTGGTGGGGDLAFTGADSSLLAAGGMSLLLVGGAAVVYSRKRS